MTARNQIIFWSCAFFAFIGFVALFKSVLLPFVLGLAIAYLLNPMVKSFGKISIGRGFAALIILSGFFLLVGLFLALVLPLLYRQSLQLINEIPNYAQSFWDIAKPYINEIAIRLGINEDTDITAILQNNSETATSIAKRLAGSLAAGGQAVFDIISITIFTPIVAYFVMKEWDRITAWVEDLLPRKNKEKIRDLLTQIDQKVSGFVRGQISVAIILGLAYAIALSIAGLKYGALIGLASGLLSIIPMFGSITGLAVSVIVAWFQSYDPMFVGIIAAIFLIGQFIEGNVLSPKIVGDSVGLHPLWVFFALLAGGALFGVVGMLLAVPVAAVAGVLLAFGIGQYKSSQLYKGGENHPSKKPAKKLPPKSTPLKGAK